MYRTGMMYRMFPGSGVYRTMWSTPRSRRADVAGRQQDPQQQEAERPGQAEQRVAPPRRVRLPPAGHHLLNVQREDGGGDGREERHGAHVVEGQGQEEPRQQDAPPAEAAEV